MQVLIFCELCLKTPLHDQKIGVLPGKVDQSSPKEEKTCYAPILLTMRNFIAVGQRCTKKALRFLNASVFWRPRGSTGSKFTSVGDDVHRGPRYQGAKFRPLPTTDIRDVCCQILSICPTHKQTRISVKDWRQSPHGIANSRPQNYFRSRDNHFHFEASRKCCHLKSHINNRKPLDGGKVLPVTCDVEYSLSVEPKVVSSLGCSFDIFNILRVRFKTTIHALKIAPPWKSGPKFTKIWENLLRTNILNHAKFHRSAKRCTRKALKFLPPSLFGGSRGTSWVKIHQVCRWRSAGQHQSSCQISSPFGNLITR